MKNEGPNVFGQMPAVPKFLASLLLMLALSVTAAAQNRKISIDMQNVTVKEFFAEIEKRSDYTFAYNNSEIDLAARVSVRAVDEEIVAVVDRTLAPQRLRARIEGNRVVLSPGRAAVPPPLLHEAREGRKDDQRSRYRRFGRADRRGQRDRQGDEHRQRDRHLG